MIQIILILQQILNLYCFLIIVWVLLSWFGNAQGVVRDIYQLLDKVVGPYVRIFKRLIPPLGGFDFSPLAALLVLQIVGGFLLRQLL
jgi:YggT family protein